MTEQFKFVVHRRPSVILSAAKNPRVGHKGFFAALRMTGELQQFVFDGVAGGCAARVHADLTVDRADMRADGPFAND